MAARVYVETSVIGYAASRISNNLLTAAHQQLTREWWDAHRPRFDCYVSQIVVDELAAGEPELAQKRLALIEGLAVLDVTPEALALARSLVDGGVVPESEWADALHISLAAVHGMDYLVTWNCAHIANAQIRGPVTDACEGAGYGAPIICTPEELMGDDNGS
jgi:hypothetical protein